jgi:hypothetical protein
LAQPEFFYSVDSQESQSSKKKSINSDDGFFEKYISDELVEKEANNACRKERDETLSPDPDGRKKIFSVKPDNSQNCGKLNNDIKSFGKFRNGYGEIFLGEDEVTGAGNREELGEAFDNGKNDSLENSH